MSKTRVKYGANGAIYYEPIEDDTPVETPVVEEKKQVIPEFFTSEDYKVESKPKKKKKKKVIQEVFGDNEDL